MKTSVIKGFASWLTPFLLRIFFIRKIAIENLAILQTGDLPAILRCRHIFALHRIGHIRLIAKMDSASSGSQLASFPKNQCLFLGSNRLWKNSLSSMKKHVRGFPTYYEAVSQCHCEGAKRPKQSHNILKIKRLPRSLRSLAMTKWALRHSLYLRGQVYPRLKHSGTNPAFVTPD